MMMMMEEGRAVLMVRFYFSFFLSLRRSFCEGLGYTIALFFSGHFDGSDDGTFVYLTAFSI
jgi:hypothetical protein